MKKLISHFITLLLILLINVSCDFVQNANPPLEPTSVTTTGSMVIYRKVLVEDYTGHKCGNCPTAADVLTTLETQYPGKIIPLAIHAGFFAGINTTTYPTDFRTIAGNAYDTQFGISTAGNPNGLINRVGYGTGGFIKAYSVWGSEVSQMVTQSAKFQIKIKNTFITSSNSINTDITVKSLANNTGTYKLVVLLTEDSIIAEQIDYRLPSGSQLINNYQFNHVLRGAINSEWGDAIFTTSNPALNDSVVKSYSNYIINSTYKAAKCHVIAYVYDADAASPTYYEVLQAEEEKVK
jgi:thiol-disulfide isomerase/thioredoxin